MISTKTCCVTGSAYASMASPTAGNAPLQTCAITITQWYARRNRGRKRRSRETACRKKDPLACHAERERSIWSHQAGGVAHLGFFAAAQNDMSRSLFHGMP